MQFTLARRLAAEAIGTALLLANSLATGCVLAGLIATLGPISGAHFNPAVTVALTLQKEFATRDLTPYVLTQIVAAFGGVAVAHAMFDLSVFSAATHIRTGTSQWWSEFVATFGLLSIICAGTRQRLTATPCLIAAYITGAYWFTASTSFANPAVTLARAASDTFAGIRPVDVGGFVIAQFAGATTATILWRWLLPPRGDVAPSLS